MRRFAIICAAVVWAGSAVAAPRIAPVAESAWTDEQKAVVADFWKGPVGNDVRTFVTNPELVRGLSPFANYIINDTTLTPRQRSLLMLRTAWLCGSDYLWGKHAKGAGLSAPEIRRIAEGPDAKGWTPLEAALLRAADDLHRDSIITTPTWLALSKDFGTAQLIDTTFTVAEFTMLATTLNSIGVAPDVGAAPFPSDVPRPVMGRRGHDFLTTPRIPALPPEQWTPEVRAMLDPTNAGRSVIGVLRTFAQHPAMYVKRATISDHIRSHTSLTPRMRELLIMRILARTSGHGEWSLHGAGAGNFGIMPEEVQRTAVPGYAGWSPADANMMRAVDEIYDADKVSAETWAALKGQLEDRQIMDLLVTAGGYRMVAMAINTFGVQLEPGRVMIPPAP